MLAAVIQAARRNPSRLTAMFRHFGALGLFFLAILDSSPLPTFAGPDILIIILAAAHRNPWYEYAAVATAGSLIGAYFTFRLARRAGRAYLESKFGRRHRALWRVWEQGGTGALIASTAVPFPFPTSFVFAAAGASETYQARKYLALVALCRAARYSAIALLADLYGRRIIRVLRHPTQHWGWFAGFALIFIFAVVAGFVFNRHMRSAYGEASTPHQAA